MTTNAKTDGRGARIARALLLHSPVRRPRRGAGWWAWLFQRLTGVGLSAYLLVHILVISSALRGAGSFDRALGVFDHPLWVVFDLGLIAVVLYHALNGVRVLLFDAGIGMAHQAALFWGALAATAAVTGVATYFTWPLIVG